MARTELPNGVILPAEYSDDWYEDMTSNLTKLDDVIGSDSEKLNSNDVAFLRMSSAALTDGGTGNFSDLNSSNKLKTGDYVLDSGRKLYQVVSVDSTNETFTVGNSLFKITAESDLAPVAESGDYDDLDNKPDLNPYDQHIVNTDIHVTTADKNKWNNQTYVFRYSGTAVVPNSTIAYSTIDNTDNIKSGDKILDVDGKLFEITAVDTTNQTVTVGSALIDLALDANVVHTSGNETVDGQKSFSKYITSDGSSIGDEYSNNARTNLWLMSNRDTEEVSGILFDTFRQNTAQGTGLHILGFGIKENSVRYEGCRFSWLWDNNLSGYTFDFKPTTQGTNQAVKHNLGTSTDKWSEVHSVTYYYGSSDTEFSQKFVTTDTAQTIGQNKTFTGVITINHTKGGVFQLTCPDLDNTVDATGNWATFISFNSVDGGQTVANKGTVGLRQFKNGKNFALLFAEGSETLYFGSKSNSDSTKALYPANSGVCSLGTSTNKWSTINGINPGALSLPDLNSAVDISGYFTLGSTTATYTAVANGWISIKARSSAASAIAVESNNDFCTGLYSQILDPNTGYRILDISFPVLLGETYDFLLRSVDVSLSAKFFPCLGNV